MKIGIQGVPGSFCEVAAKQYFQADHVENIYLHNSHNVCEALSNNLIDRGVIAVENSIGGIVEETKLALAAFPLRVLDEIEIPIVQCLMSVAPIPFEQITEIHSHPQALAQSTAFIASKMPNAKVIPEEDTALCAQHLRDGKWSNTAVMIGNAACAEIYGLRLLQEGTQNTDNNRTRCIILASG